MSSKSKKGRNPGAVDNWLDSIGLYRKNVAYDETCLFRAVSEQLFECQIYHERVRKECVDYGRKNYMQFANLLNEDEWYDHMDLLEKHMVVCGNIEIQLISYKYDYDVTVYDATHQQVMDVTKRNLDSTLMLCLMNEDHYDVIYKRVHIQNAGFCQSIVYGILYENVFKVPKVQDIVRKMLYEKEFVAASFAEINNNLNIKTEIKTEKSDDNNVDASPPVAPFPFKVAKALDPAIYRNIEYDSWTEVRREMRLGDWYYGDDNLILGTRCILNKNEDTFECYIQEIIKDENKCVVYVTKLAEKLTVNYTDLSPENDAKPWPLPYRFSKNLLVSTQTNSTSEKTLKMPKKRKDRRRIKSNSESSAQSQVVSQPEATEQDIKAFIGVPLQMQNTPEPSYATEKPIETPETPLSQHNLLVTPEIPSPMPKFSWETPWSNYAPVSSEQILWSHHANTPQNMCNYKPMIASAPVTPDAVPYHGSHYPFVYNYHVENYNSYNSWSPHNDYNTLQNQETVAMELEDSKESVEQQLEASGQIYVENSYESQQVLKERPTLCTSLPPPSNSQVEIFSPVIPVHPGTPVITCFTPEMTEMSFHVPTAPVQVYTPPVDLQYVSPGPFIYPPTPPTAWYPPGINSQGFIFPPPINQNLNK